MLFKITVLIENTVGKPLGLTGEHGLSLWVETAGHRFLYDTGQSGAVVRNAAVLGVPLQETDAIVLSHGHYDHTGGLRKVLKAIGRPIPVYAHPELFSRHRVADHPDRYAGVPFDRDELESCGAEFHWIEEARQIFPDVWASGAVPKTNTFERGDSRLYIHRDGDRIPDPLRDDLSLYLVTPEGLVILTGCAHTGVVNITEHARFVTGCDRVRALIGGTHLGPVDAEQLEKTISYLKDLDLELLAAAHCTGLPVAARLAVEFGRRFSFGSTGVSFSF